MRGTSRTDTGRPRLSRRAIAVLTGVAVVGGMAAVAQVSSAGTIGFPARGRPEACATSGAGAGTGQRHRHAPLAANATDPALDDVTESTPAVDPSAAARATGGNASSGASQGGNASQGGRQAGRQSASAAPPSGGTGGRQQGGQGGQQGGNRCSSSSAGAGNGNGNGNQGGGLDILSDSCDDSKLQAHDGFQNAPRCVGTEFGEVGAAAQNPSLIISNAPQRVRAKQTFTIQVSSRNLVRDRFLAAAAGGYYVERSILNGQGLQRGHIHTVCRMIQSTRVAPDPDPVPAFFKATEDGGGGGQPDVVTVEVTGGLPAPGLAQCSVWAGDGSHRLPMMQRANQMPAFDVVRITVTP